MFSVIVKREVPFLKLFPPVRWIPDSRAVEATRSIFVAEVRITFLAIAARTVFTAIEILTRLWGRPV